MENKLFGLLCVVVSVCLLTSITNSQHMREMNRDMIKTIDNFSKMKIEVRVEE